MDFNGSDHRPLVSIFDSKRKKATRIFRYDRRLRDNEEVRQLITKIWLDSVALHSEERLARVRKALVKWSRDKHINSKAKIEQLKSDLDAALSSSTGDDVLISRLNKELISAYKAEEEFWRQRSRIIWLASGDKNSQFFHAVASGKKARNQISIIEDPAGNIYYEEEQIASQIAPYYGNLLVHSQPNIKGAD